MKWRFFFSLGDVLVCSQYRSFVGMNERQKQEIADGQICGDLTDLNVWHSKDSFPSTAGSSSEVTDPSRPRIWNNGYVIGIDSFFPGIQQLQWENAFLRTQSSQRPTLISFMDPLQTSRCQHLLYRQNILLLLTLTAYSHRHKSFPKSAFSF